MAEVETQLKILRETVGIAKAYDSVSALTSTQMNQLFLAGALSYTSPFEQFRRLSIREVLQIAAVMVCLDILSQDIAKTTLRLYKKVPGGKAVVEPNQHPMAAMLALEPNRWHHWYELIEMMMLHLALHQNAFWYKRSSPTGVPLEFLPLMPGAIEIEPKPEQGIYIYRLTKMSDHDRVMLAGVPDILIDEEIVHFRGRMFDGLTGYSNIEAGAKTFAHANEILAFSARSYAADGMTKAVFRMQPETQLSDEAFGRLKEQLTTGFRELLRAGKPMLLEEGLEMQPLQGTQEQAEASKNFGDAVVNVARQFRIPPHKIFHLVNIKYENMETMEGSYVFDTLIPWCNRIEQRLARDTLDKKERLEFFYEFDREEMILHDPKVQAEMLNVLLPHGVVTIDEARKARGLNPLPGGAGRSRLIGSTYTLVDENNNVVLAAGGKTPEMMDAEIEAMKKPDPAPAPAAAPAAKPAAKPKKDLPHEDA